VADARTNALLVVDDEETLHRVREFLLGFDKLGKQARIRVRFDESGVRERTSVEARARASGEDWSVSAGKPMRKDGWRSAFRIEPFSAGEFGIFRHRGLRQRSLYHGGAGHRLH